MDFWGDLSALSDWLVNHENLVRVVAAVLLVFLVLVLKNALVRISIRLLDRFLQRTGEHFRSMLAEAVEKPGRFLVLVLGLYLAGRILGLRDQAVFLADRLVASLLVFGVFWAVYKGIGLLLYLLRKLFARRDTAVENAVFVFIGKALKVLVFTLGAVSVAQAWGYNVLSLLAGLGLGGLALALAAKDTAANLFGGITLMTDKPFKVGDWIATPQVEGTVEEIGFRSTRVRTFAHSLVTVPNSVLCGDTITNWSRMGKRRVQFRLGLVYATTPDQLRLLVQTLREMLKTHPDVHPDMVFVYFEKFAESSLNILIYFFTRTIQWQEYLAVQEDINFRIMEILASMGLSVAFPSRSVYMEKAAHAKTGEQSVGQAYTDNNISKMPF